MLEGNWAQPRLLLDIESGISASTPLNYSARVINNKLYFVAKTFNGGEELYVTDGTPQGTKLVKDINTTNSKDATPVMFMQIGDNLLFGADNGVDGKELWISDGNESGTTMIKDIYSGSSSGMDHVNGNLQNFISYNDIVFFAGRKNSSEGSEFWTSDGSANGTNLVKDIHPSDASSPIWFCALNGKIYFNAKSELSGEELHCFDPQMKTVNLVKDIFPGKSGSFITNMTTVGSNLMFGAYENSTLGIEPYISDGTAAGTRLLKDLKSGNGNSNPSRFTYVNGKIFFRANDSLYVTDGTALGTINLGLGLGADFPSYKWATDGMKLLLPASRSTDNVGRELYITDGTLVGTKLLKDIRRFANASEPRYLLYANKLFYFSANNGTNGEELWVSDGTEAGTRLLVDFVPGALGSSPHDLVFFNKYLFFYADNLSVGAEPYVLELQVVKNETVVSDKLLISETESNWIIKSKSPNIFSSGKVGVVLSDIQGKTLSNSIIDNMDQEIKIIKPSFKGVYIISLTDGVQVLNAKVLVK